MRRRKARHSLVNNVVWLLASMLRPLPFEVSRRVAGSLGSLSFDLFGKERGKVLRHLEIAYGDALPAEERRRVGRRLFRNYGYGVAELLQFPKGDRFFGSLRVEIEGREHLDWAVREGKGCVFVTAHAGNWELLAAWLARGGYPVNVVARTARHSNVEDILRRHREAAGVRVLARRASTLAMVRVLRQGEGLGILCDVDTRGDGVFVDYFGRLAYTQTGPARLAARTGAPLIIGFIARGGPRTHRIVVLPPVWVGEEGCAQKGAMDIPTAVQHYTAEIERWVRRYPDQWIWTHPRWRTRPPGEERAE